jgi:hypothetical protein
VLTSIFFTFLNSACEEETGEHGQLVLLQLILDWVRFWSMGGLSFYSWFYTGLGFVETSFDGVTIVVACLELRNC